MKLAIVVLLAILLAGCTVAESEQERPPPQPRQPVYYPALFHIEKLVDAGCGYYVYREEFNEQDDNRWSYEGSGKPLFVFHDDSAKLLERAWLNESPVKVWFTSHWFDTPCTDYFGRYGIIRWAENFAPEDP